MRSLSLLFKRNPEHFRSTLLLAHLPTVTVFPPPFYLKILYEIYYTLCIPHNPVRGAFMTFFSRARAVNLISKSNILSLVPNNLYRW